VRRWRGRLYGAISLPIFAKTEGRGESSIRGQVGGVRKASRSLSKGRLDRVDRGEDEDVEVRSRTLPQPDRLFDRPSVSELKERPVERSYTVRVAFLGRNSSGVGLITASAAS
jgi:hypothetical protein